VAVVRCKVFGISVVGGRAASARGALATGGGLKPSDLLALEKLGGVMFNWHHSLLHWQQSLIEVVSYEEAMPEKAASVIQ